MNEAKATQVSALNPAWDKPESVSAFHRAINENKGTRRLQNLIEVGLVEQHADGQKILDVGVGTARATLPLLQKGCQMTGLDSSQAMLDECARHTAGLPIELHLGNALALPFAQNEFDTVVALDVFTEMPDWRLALSEASRVAKPGGRIIVNIVSADHVEFAASAATPDDDPGYGLPANAETPIHSNSLIDYADEAGLSVVAMVPYGVFFSGRHRRFNKKYALNAMNWWKRHMSFIATDPSLFEAALFMERELFARLGTRHCGRCMFIMEKRAGGAENDRLRQQHADLDQALQAGVSLENMAPCLKLPVSEWRNEFIRHVIPLRNRVVAYLLLTSIFNRPDIVDLNSFFGEAYGREVGSWLVKEYFDWSLHLVQQDWMSGGEVAKILRWQGLDLSSMLEYDLKVSANQLLRANG